MKLYYYDFQWVSDAAFEYDKDGNYKISKILLDFAELNKTCLAGVVFNLCDGDIRNPHQWDTIIDEGVEFSKKHPNKLFKISRMKTTKEFNNDHKDYTIFYFKNGKYQQIDASCNL